MAEGFSSELDTPEERFLSLTLQYSLAEKWLSPEDVVSEFPPQAIMAALEGAPELRSKLLVESVGVHAKIAPKKSTAAAAEDLELALNEGVCTASELLLLLTADEQVRYFDSNQLWSFLTRDEFYREASQRERDRMLFLLQTGLDQELIDLNELVTSVGTKKLANQLPKRILEKVFIEAVSAGLDGGAFDAESLILTVPLTDWVENLPLEHLWETAGTELSVRAGLAEKSTSTASPAVESQAPPAPSKAKGKGKSKSNAAKKADEKSAAPPSPQEQGDEVEVVNDDDLQVFDGPSQASAPEISVGPLSERSRDEIAARERALGNLKALGRELRSPESLTTSLLLAIDGMYSELVTLSDDDSRAECIREAFPNEKLLIEGLYALAESLDPKLDSKALREKEADVDSLMQLVLFEERRRDSGLPSRSSSPPPVIPAPPSELSTRSIPPVPLPPPPPPKG